MEIIKDIIDHVQAYMVHRHADNDQGKIPEIEFAESRPGDDTSQQGRKDAGGHEMKAECLNPDADDILLPFIDGIMREQL